MKITKENFKGTEKDLFELNKVVDGCLVQIKGRIVRIARESGGKKVGHIMLSYNWGTKELVRKLKKELQVAGLKTWMDEENLGPGDLYEALAEAVENSKYVLFCYSEGYKKSAACRSEAEYADKLGKSVLFVRCQKCYKPDGWLGFMLGNKLYYDVTGDDAKFKSVFKQIIDHLNKLNSPTNTPTVSQPKSISAIPEKSSSKQDKENSAADLTDPAWTKWSVKEVQCWLEITNLQFAQK